MRGAFVCKTLGMVVTGLGVVTYLFLGFLSSLSWTEHPSIHSSHYRELGFILEVVFGAGLPPLIVAASSLPFADSALKLFRACFLTIAFVIVHYVTLVWMSHSSPWIYVPMALAEFIFSIWMARSAWLVRKGGPPIK